MFGFISSYLIIFLIINLIINLISLENTPQPPFSIHFSIHFRHGLAVPPSPRCQDRVTAELLPQLAAAGAGAQVRRPHHAEGQRSQAAAQQLEEDVDETWLVNLLMTNSLTCCYGKPPYSMEKVWKSQL